VGGGGILLASTSIAAPLRKEPGGILTKYQGLALVPESIIKATPWLVLPEGPARANTKIQMAPKLFE
jgi:hypothetical protein